MSGLRPTIIPQWLRGLIPVWLKPSLREAICRVVDGLDWVFGRCDALTPPARLRVRVGCFASFIRVDRYRVVGEEFANHLVNIAGLTTDSRLLDIGCGCGQVAAALTSRIGELGAYDGFDPDATAIAWCREHISSRFPNFHFAHADLANTQYNPAGGMRAEEFRFPYADQTFDVILLKSVFTHMPGRQMEHYLSEIQRMLRPGGRCFASYFLLNAESRANIDAGDSAYIFEHQGEGCYILDPNVPDYLVAYDEERVQQAAARAGLKLSDPIHYGSWCGRSRYLSFQDLVLLSVPG
jgi:SAM-dependent methyltransferase